MKLSGRKYVVAIAAVCTIAMAGPVEAANLAGTVGAITKPVTTALGGLMGGGTGGGAPGSGVSGLPGFPSAPSLPGSGGADGSGGGGGGGLSFAPGGDSSATGDGFYVRAAADGNVGYNVMITKKLLAW
ncbi:MAG: hypothetical protein P4L72_06890 [Parvibaculum sp.]|uniref:hypothetical protein n=1 Tax=Parvibaculum sp. TaxID=2024848 RepID=UPI002840A258|nr:hypothetical protein [Parvibaculum sp.]MDR3498936.1 hypothetical protein [Parvibaculum sp.]